MKRHVLLLSIALSAVAPACDHPDTTAARGHALYQSYGCAACHGPTGGGNGPAAARAMIRPRDLRAAASFTRGTTVEAISATVRNGMRATGMPSYEDLPDDEVRAIANWIVSIQKEKR